MGQEAEGGVTYLLDTNVLIYAADEDEPDRMEKANDLLQRLTPTRQAVVSAQVLTEFVNVALRQGRTRASVEEVYRQVEVYARTLVVLPVTPAIVLEAVRGVRDYQFAYYDAQIWAAARLNQVRYVLSEDFNTGATLDGITFLDPFASDPDFSRM